MGRIDYISLELEKKVALTRMRPPLNMKETIKAKISIGKKAVALARTRELKSVGSDLGFMQEKSIILRKRTKKIGWSF